MSIPFLDSAVSIVYPFVVTAAVVLTPVGAVIACTAVLRLLLLPLTVAAVRGERSRAVLAPRMAELRREHGSDRAWLGTEVAALHREAGTSPLAGCLPMLAQTPIFMVWYRIFAASRIGGRPNALLAHRFLGAALSTHLVGGGHPLVFVPLLLIMAVTAFFTVRRGRLIAASTGTPAPAGPLRWLPFASLLSALFLPFAAILYLTTTTTWTAIENTVLRRGLPART